MKVINNCKGIIAKLISFAKGIRFKYSNKSKDYAKIRKNDLNIMDVDYEEIE